MKSSASTAKSWALASAFIFSMTSIGIVQATENVEVPEKQCDVSDSIGPGDSGYLRDDCPPNRGVKKKQKQQQKNNSPSSEQYDQYDKDDGYSGTGPKREGRY